MVIIKHSSDMCSYSIGDKSSLLEWFAQLPNLYD